VGDEKHTPHSNVHDAAFHPENAGVQYLGSTITIKDESMNIQHAVI
jgi:hypothetical protein